MKPKGIKIKFIEQKQTGSNSLGEPIFSETEEIIENVLIAPTTADEALSSTDLAGRKEVYTLAIPKGDTHNWDYAVVEFFGKRYKACAPAMGGIDELVPLSWGKKVRVERYE